jgi:hypothetical protein
VWRRLLTALSRSSPPFLWTENTEHRTRLLEAGHMRAAGCVTKHFPTFYRNREFINGFTRSQVTACVLRTPPILYSKCLWSACKKDLGNRIASYWSAGQDRTMIQSGNCGIAGALWTKLSIRHFSSFSFAYTHSTDILTFSPCLKIFAIFL